MKIRNSFLSLPIIVLGFVAHPHPQAHAQQPASERGKPETPAPAAPAPQAPRGGITALLQGRPQLKPETFEKALEIVSFFETSSKSGWGKVTGDFDGQGISCGIFQWNIGKKSLQPIVTSAGKDAVLKYMPTHGGELWRACTGDVVLGLAIVRTWQDTVDTVVNGKTRRRATWKKGFEKVPVELKALFSSPEMRGPQLAAAQAVGQSAWKNACAFAQAARGGGAEPTLAEFTTFLDAQVFNGGMAKLTHADVLKLKASIPQGQEMAHLCDWLAKANEPSFQWKEARQNATLWRTKQPAQDTLDLLLLQYLRALRAEGSNGTFKANVLSRRGTILFNDGWVNGARISFDALK